MSLKQSNEITVKVKGNLDNLYKLLEEKSFKISNELSLEPSSIQIISNSVKVCLNKLSKHSFK